MENEQNDQITQQFCMDCGKSEDLIIYSSASSKVCESCFDLRQDSLFIPIHKILDNLFLGSLQAIQNNVLQQNQIKAICSCGRGMKIPSNIQIYEYKNIPVGDLQEQNIFDYFQEFYQWVDQKRNKKLNVLIHCAAGASRSASFVISYVMKHKKLNFKETLKFVQSIRKCVDPNDGFKKQLQKWQFVVMQK